MTLETSLVSRYNQVMAKTDTKGIDAKIEPKNELCFAISETTTMIIEVIKNLNTKYAIEFLCIQNVNVNKAFSFRCILKDEIYLNKNYHHQ